MQKKPFLTPADIALELDISTSTVLRKVHAGEIPAIRRALREGTTPERRAALR